MEAPNAVVPKELVTRARSFEEVRANSYATRDVYSLTVAGIEGKWHSVKGGRKLIKGSQPEVLFNPDTMQWLKVANKEGQREGKRIRTSAEIIRASLRLGGMEDLAEQVHSEEIMLRGHSLPAYVTPHIGPSLETMINLLRRAKLSLSPEAYAETSQEARQFFSSIYALAFDQAVQLYLRYGYWIQDPNPGNILFNTQGDGQPVRVAMIDFDTRTQRREPGYFGYIENLQNYFQEQANLHSIPFSVNLEEYRPQCKAQKPMNLERARTPLVAS